MSSELVKISHESLRLGQLFTLNGTWGDFKLWATILRCSVKLNILLVYTGQYKRHS